MWKNSRVAEGVQFSLPSKLVSAFRFWTPNKFLDLRGLTNATESYKRLSKYLRESGGINKHFLWDLPVSFTSQKILEDRK